MPISNQVQQLSLYIFFLLLVFLFFWGGEEWLHLMGGGESLREIFLIFLSLLVEALPFLIIGSLFSSFIHVWISEQFIIKAIPKNTFSSILVAIFISVITPVCECAIIPVVRRLMKKGLPVHVGSVLLVGAPVLNITVFYSTLYAFPDQPLFSFVRMFICILAAFLVGCIMSLLFLRSDVFKMTKEDLSQNTVEASRKGNSKWKATLHHTCHEFFQIGRYFIVGAFLASLVQYYTTDFSFIGLPDHEYAETGFMMVLAFLLSICSEADAFVAATFEGAVRPVAILGFLVYGPVIDLKNFFVMFSCFNVKFNLAFLIAVTSIIFTLVVVVGPIIT